ncbi:MAG: hypothetical protein COY58_08120 [Gammaproteobacteria bacterium CG_4_10_14_0_8_um_filter_38_16]|nr:MAG: hypothetical protein COY58_08120 [Gammaproteobacteria bacterium CG_4_10_14_0_8_um_filter_38_16]PJA04290.1 MAG: hypothetical protein COX72_00875 [Gammaproteobacteria bacterium CG_4_10_14_0_2_um_filter_38_22]PJB11563.1 MAG: hypothetical protein CO120_00055 [Gammaproteobacteria bacterium CG_4_9_14_3_um_filter_38_9]
MDLQEVLRKQKERGFKKPLGAASNTLSINDYLSDPHASRPYIDDVSASKTLSVVKNANAVEAEAKPQPIIITETAKVTDVVNVEVELNTAPETSEPEKTPAITTPVEITPVKQPVISDTKATQEFRSATQQSSSATQELYSENTKVTQQFRSATQTATQQLRKNYSKAGRPKIECFDYTKLVGNELSITNEIYTECLKSKSFETGYIEKNEFSQRVKVKSGAIRTSCTRLKSKGILEDFIATKGRGSAWKFVLSENIFHQISMKNTLKLSAISDTNSDTKILSSSSDINNNKNTTTTQLPADWKKIEYVELQKTLNIYNERFGLAQIKTVFAEAGDLITAEDVQTSIHNFTIGLNNYTQKQSPGIYHRKVKIATLLESLKNGEVFIDPQVEALKEAQAKKIAAERRAEMAAQYFEPKFEYYFASLSDEQAVAFVPAVWKNSNAAWEHAVKTNNVLVQKSYAKDFAKEHFEKNIWPEVLKTLL